MREDLPLRNIYQNSLQTCVLPYIAVMIDMRIVESCDNRLKPYTIIKDKAEISELMDAFRQNHDLNNSYTPNLHDNDVNRRYA